MLPFSTRSALTSIVCALQTRGGPVDAWKGRGKREERERGGRKGREKGEGEKEKGRRERGRDALDLRAVT